MFRSYASSHMNMKADIYVQKNTQSDSGHIARKWVYEKTVWCRAEAVELTRRGKHIDQSVDGFLDELLVKLKTIEPISRRYRITAIKSNDNKSVYQELDKIALADTIFEVRDSHAVIDPIGRISYYETILRRSVVQENDIYQN